MRQVTWRCDWCEEGVSNSEEMPSHWNTLMVKVWDGTEAGYPEAWIGKKVFHFCSEEHKQCFFDDNHYEEHKCRRQS